MHFTFYTSLTIAAITAQAPTTAAQETEADWLELAQLWQDDFADYDRENLLAELGTQSDV